MKNLRPGKLEINVETRDGSGTALTVIRAEGEVDLANADELGRAIAAADRVVVDLTGVPFMDSSGLRVLLVEAERRESALPVVIQPGSPVRRLFELSQVGDWLACFEDEAAALAAAENA